MRNYIQQQLLKLARGGTRVKEEKVGNIGFELSKNSTDKAGHVKAVTICFIFFLFFLFLL